MMWHVPLYHADRGLSTEDFLGAGWCATLRVMASQNEDFSLKFGYWFAVHRDQLRTWWAISILVVDVLLLVVFAVTFTSYSFSTAKTVHGVSQMATPLVSSTLQSALTPVKLTVETAVAIDRGSGRYDFVAPVSNTNQLWAAVQVTYHFTYGAQTSRDEKTILWPGMNAYLTEMNVALNTPASGDSVRAVVTDVRWIHPTDPTLAKSITFPMSGSVIAPVAGTSGTTVGTRLSASLKNNSVYGFKSVRFIIIVKTGGTVIGVGDTIVEHFRPLESRPIEVTWLQSLPATAEAIAFPVLNIFDRGSFE